MTEKCPICNNGDLVREIRICAQTYNGHTISAEQGGDWCTSCGEGILSYDDAKLYEYELGKFKAAIDMIEKKILGLCTGVFDILHVGHVKMLQDAAEKCDFLVVGILEDPTLENPNKSKPIQSINERTQMVNAIKGVGAIFVYNTEQELYDHIKNSNYDIRVIGSDWKGKQITGYDIPGHLEKCYYHDRSNHGYSTTDLRQRIIDASDNKPRRDFLKD